VRYLICSASSPGLLFPLVGLALELRRRGHEVMFATGLDIAELLAQFGFERIPRTDRDGRSFTTIISDDPMVNALDIKHIEYAINLHAPDAILTHQLCTAPLVVRQKQHIPTAVMGLFSYLYPTLAGDRLEVFPQGAEQRRLRLEGMVNTLNRTLRAFRLPPVRATPQENPLLGDLFLLRSTPELSPDLEFLPSQVHVVGACLWEPPIVADLQWEAVSAGLSGIDGPVIYVQHGRTFDMPGFWLQLVDAIRDRPCRILASLGRMDQETGELPANVVARAHISQTTVLSRANLSISGGHSTVLLGSLSNGVPCIAIPTGGEMPDNAERLVSLRCGVSLDALRLSVASMRDAIDLILHGDRAVVAGVGSASESLARFEPFKTAAALVEQLGSTQSVVCRSAARLAGMAEFGSTPHSTLAGSQQS
jgi:UDP:flavonoid glycosyltransferase YjiC (YdhE family)